MVETVSASSTASASDRAALRVAPGLRGISGGELARKIVHMAVGLIAFAVVFLGPALSALAALTAVLMNLFVLPRLGGKALWRERESARGMSLGIVLYPFAVLLLILVFWQKLEVAAAIWGILAFGDGMASVVGMAYGRRRLPWNPEKTWAGTLAYWIFGTLGASVLLWWTATNPLGLSLLASVNSGGREISIGFVLLICALTAAFAAFVESLAMAVDDNIAVPLLAGLVLFGLLSSESVSIDWSAIGSNALVGAGINLLFAVAAYRARSVDRSGGVAGFAVGTLIFASLGWRGYVLLMTFFVLGSLATKLGYRRKADAGLAQEGGGRRAARHALANTGVATLAAVFAAITPFRELYLFAFAGAFATALADTLGSEIGQLMGRRTFLVTTLRPVPRGTEGAISLEGTIAGAIGALLVGCLGFAAGFFGPWGIAVVATAAVLGSLLESVIGATLEKRAMLDNESVNFLNTLIGAVLAVGIAVLVR